MEMTLISLHPEILSVGIRSLSSCVKQAGHKINLIFLPEMLLNREPDRKRYAGRYHEKVLSGITEICRASGLVGISVLSNYFPSAVTLTKAIKSKHNVPVVWGGPYPSAEPVNCLKYADMVAMGEAEEALVELLDCISSDKDFRQIPNIWSRDKNGIIRNRVRPLIQDLDALPLPDCDILGQYVLRNGSIQVLNEHSLTKNSLFKGGDEGGITYLVLSSRGCPHRCTYCINDMLQEMYNGQRYLRRRGINAICDELAYAVDKIPRIDSVNFADDNFASMPIKQLEAFFELYSNRIGLPFSLSLSPEFTDPHRLKLLADSGCYRVSMGIQSASKRILKLYGRGRFSINQCKEAIERLENLRPLMTGQKQITYHFIVDNPYEIPDDKIETLEFILNMKRKGSIFPFSLVPFQGTKIFNMMCRDKLIVNEYKQIFTKDFTDREPGFTKYWLYMYYGGVPDNILRSCLKPWLVRVMDRRNPEFLYNMIDVVLETGYRLIGSAKRFVGGVLGSVLR